MAARSRLALRPGSARRFFWLSTFAVAMGILEAAVVVYLRELYYPEGFRFPLVAIPDRVAFVEVAREAMTILMLLAVAALSGRDALDRFFVFGFLFGVWDVMYYATLRLVLGWPDSLQAWDVLFLIPVPWVSPVLYPLIVSVALVVGFVAHELVRGRGAQIRPGRVGWAFAAAGAAGIVASFCWRSREALQAPTPGAFPVALFAACFVLALAPFLLGGVRALRE